MTDTTATYEGCEHHNLTHHGSGPRSFDICDDCDETLTLADYLDR